MSILGIDIGAGSIKAGLVEKDGTILCESRVPTFREMTNQDFEKSLQNLIHEVTKGKTVLGVGIGSPGPIDSEKGVIHASANLPHLQAFPIASYIKEQWGWESVLNNDANAAAVGEYFFGKGKGSTNLFVFTLGTGLGGGWVWNGKLYNGFQGNGMEVGHTTVVIDGELCGCKKRGCAEAYFSARGFLNRFKEKTNVQLESAKEFFNLVRNKHPQAEEILNFGIQALSEATRNIVNLLNVDTIVYVGGLTQSWDLFGYKLETNVRTKIFTVLEKRLKIYYGQNQAILGAASLFLERG